MKILILGGDGMLGHQLLNSFKEKFEVKVTLRKHISEYTHYKIFTHDNISRFSDNSGSFFNFL